MKALIVGGDHVNTYKNFLLLQGYGAVLHWPGRKNNEYHRPIPADTSLMVILVDQVSHQLASKMRRAAVDLDLPVVFSRRSIGQLDQAFARFRATAHPGHFL